MNDICPLPGQVVLVTGPARSGKSEWAETLATRFDLPVTYVATAQVDATDPEWQARIADHRRRRPADWQLLEIATELADIILAAPAQSCLLVDSLGTWVANCLELDQPAWSQQVQEFLHGLQTATCMVILVAEETGWGVIPAYPSGRCFRDRLGNLTRKIGAIADPVYLVTAGYVLNLRELGNPLP